MNYNKCNVVEIIREVFDDTEEIASWCDETYNGRETQIHLLGLYAHALEACDEIERLQLQLTHYADALVAAEKDKQIAFLKDSHDAIRELAYKTGAAEEREATISKIESEICHAEINNLRLAPLFGQQHGPLAVRVDSLAAVVDAIRARGEA